MSDLRAYTARRRRADLAFDEGFDAGYEDFKIGVLLRQAREAAGMTQDEVARRLGTKESAISRMENHADDVRLSTLRNYAEAIGASLEITLAQARQHLVREERAAYQLSEVVEDEDAQDDAERQKFAQSEKLRSILDDAELHIQATGGIKHEDFWNQMEAEYQDAEAQDDIAATDHNK
jgi:transcriptional regulator with XRE-family HTH domain